MASPLDAGGPRFAGRVVDPDVREDGATEPKVELNASPVVVVTEAEVETEPEAGAEAETEANALATADASRPGRGAEVRERLLAKARAVGLARAEPTQLDHELDAVGRSIREPPTDDSADLVLAPTSGRAPSAPIAPNARELSPNLVAVFSALVGMAAIASITALFMSIETRLPEQRGALVPLTEVATSATPAPPSAPAEPKAKAKRQRQKQPGPWRLSDAKSDARYRFIEGKVGTDSFLKALETAGAPQAQGYRVLAAMRGVLDLDKCKKTDRFQALLERGSSKLFAFEYLAGPDEVYQAKETDGRLVGSKLDLKIERSQVVGALSYDGSNFERSAELAGFDPGLSKVVARALDGHMALDELERGDALRVVAQEVTVLGDFARYAGIEALELVRADSKQGKLRIYYCDSPGIRGYYDHDGRAPFEGGWRKPIRDAPRTSPFNPKRMHPVLKKIMPHQGTDFGSPTGTPVGAASFGTVSFLGNGGPAGNLVKIMHPGGVETGYAHLSRFAESLKVGDKVKRLQLIGYVGSTGRSTGPHLHFSASRDGKFFDPETLNLDGMRNLNAQEREAFKPTLAKYDPMLDAIPMPERFAPLQLVKAEAPTAASVATAAVVHEDESVGDTEEGAAPPQAGPAPVPTPGAVQQKTGSSVYLSNEELLEAQSATDDGEVEE
ncbi:MAG TPA: M23 family metallopeptidase [Polyangiaceae bacterium]|nr:M23 family metallopeptidase [Polyangiaceae bacterium]